MSDKVNFVDGHDLRLMTRAELLALRAQIDEEQAQCKQQHDAACIEFNTTGLSSDPDWMIRLKGAIRVKAAQAHRINARLAALREESRARNIAAAQVTDEHAVFLHAFYRAAKKLILEEIENGQEFFGSVIDEARDLVERADPSVMECHRCASQKALQEQKS